MKREEVIEIAEKSPIDRMPSDYHCRVPYWLALDDELEAFANEVERRTIERICKAIKDEDDRCVTQGDYMLDSDDCIAVASGTWSFPDFALQQEKQND